MVANVETSSWERIVEPSASDLSREAAEGILRLGFKPHEIDRMNRLAALARDSALTPQELSELDTYNRVAHVLALLQSKARLALRASPAR